MGGEISFPILEDDVYLKYWPSFEPGRGDVYTIVHGTRELTRQSQVKKVLSFQSLVIYYGYGHTFIARRISR